MCGVTKEKGNYHIGKPRPPLPVLCAPPPAGLVKHGPAPRIRTEQPDLIDLCVPITPTLALQRWGTRCVRLSLARGAFRDSDIRFSP